ncbi:MAG: YfiR family protein [Candidatus Ozemobacteraceae bacterium]
MKTAYIYNILQFVEWPSEKAEEKKNPFVVFVAGNDPVGDLLEELSKSPLEGRGLKIERCTDEVKPTPAAHIVFISRSLEQQLPQIIRNLQNRSVLTISDISQFCKRGGVIGFVNDGGKIKIEINLRSARDLGCKIDARFLEIARIIQ